MTSQIIELITMWLKDKRGGYECGRHKCRADDDVDSHGYILSKSDGGSLGLQLKTIFVDSTVERASS